MPNNNDYLLYKSCLTSAKREIYCDIISDVLHQNDLITSYPTSLSFNLTILLNVFRVTCFLCIKSQNIHKKNCISAI